MALFIMKVTLTLRQAIINLLKDKGTLTFLFASLIVVLYFWHHLNNFGSNLFAGQGDGLKNYYTYLYSSKYLGGSFNFAGMNYPYGESIFFLDSIPSLSWFLGLIGLEKSAIYVLHFLILICIPLTALYIYRCFEFFGHKDFFAILIAVGGAMLSPMLYGITGHFALSLSFFTPLILYRLLSEKGNLWTGIILFFAFGAHLYLGLINGSLIFFYWLFKAVFKNHKAEYLASGKRILFSLIIPFGIFFTLVSVTDQHQNRPTEPYGFLKYTSNYETFLIPTSGPFKSVTESIIPRAKKKTRRYSSPGTAVNLSILFLVFAIPISYAFKKVKTITLDSRINILLLISVFALLISMCIPFVWGLEFILEYVPNLRQFRSIGRFSWLYYFLVFISVSIILFQLTRGLKSQLRITLLLVFSSIMIAEAHENLRLKGRASRGIVNEFHHPKKNLKSALEHIDQDRYQAILTIPFLHIGSEKFAYGGSHKSMNAAFVISYRKGIPILGTNSSRTSLSETMETVELFTPDYYKPNYNFNKWNKKPLLIIASTNWPDIAEQNYLSKASLLFECSDFKLFEIKYSDFKKREESEFNYESELRSEWNKPFLFKDIDLSIQRGDSALVDLDFDGFTEFSRVNVSFWVESPPLRNTHVSFLLQEKIDGKWLNVRSFSGRAARAFVSKAYLCEHDINIVHASSPHRLIIKNASEINQSVAISKLLFNRYGDRVYWKSKGVNYINNYPLRPHK